METLHWIYSILNELSTFVRYDSLNMDYYSNLEIIFYHITYYIVYCTKSNDKKKTFTIDRSQIYEYL